MPSTTWNPADLSGVTLGANNLMATGIAQGGVRAAVGSTTGKYYYELTVNRYANANSGVGAANATATLATMGSAPTNALMVYRSGAVWLNNANSGRTIGSFTSGGIIGVALELNTYQVWVRQCPSGNWLNSSSNDPAAGTGGLSIASIASAVKALFPAFAPGVSAERVTANFGATAFSGAVPSGFTAGYPTSSLNPQANSVWSTTDKTAGTTIGSGNLRALFSTTTDGVRSAYSNSSGKYYFEITGGWFAGGTIAGAANASAVLSTVAATPTNAAVVYTGGAIWVNNVNTGTFLTPAPTGGDTVALALDLTARRIWFRSGPSGNWNSSGTANPATGVGGFDISSITGAIYGLTGTSGVTLGDDVVANFGDSAFIGTVPSGFTAGFPLVVAPTRPPQFAVTVNSG